MREIRPSGSEGGVGRKPHPYPYKTLQDAQGGGDVAGLPVRPIHPPPWSGDLRVAVGRALDWITLRLEEAPWTGAKWVMGVSRVLPGSSPTRT